MLWRSVLGWSIRVTPQTDPAVDPARLYLFELPYWKYWLADFILNGPKKCIKFPYWPRKVIYSREDRSWFSLGEYYGCTCMVFYLVMPDRWMKWALEVEDRNVIGVFKVDTTEVTHDSIAAFKYYWDDDNEKDDEEASNEQLTHN